VLLFTGSAIWRKATKVNAGLAESSGRLLLGICRDSLHVTCGLTACTPGSAPGPTLGNEYGKTLPFTRVSWYQKGKTNLDFTEARDSEWQWHQLGYMQVCTSLHASAPLSTPTPHHSSFFTGQMPFLPPNQQRQSTEDKYVTHKCRDIIFVRLWHWSRSWSPVHDDGQVSTWTGGAESVPRWSRSPRRRPGHGVSPASAERLSHPSTN